MKINGATVLSALATTTNYVLKQSSTAGTLINSQIFDNGTNIGIGTASPLGILHLYKSSATTRLLIDGDAEQSKIITYRTNGVQRFGFYLNNTAESGSNTGSDFQIRAYNDAGALLSTPFFIKRSIGYIGIGTTSPGQKLDVVGNVNIGDGINSDQNIRIRYGNFSNGYGAIRFDQAGLNNSTIHSFSTAWQSGDIYNASTGAININGANGVTFGSWNNIDVAFNTGGTSYFKNNVGIGTTSPVSKLQVEDVNKVFDGYGNINVFTTDTAATNIGGSIAFGGKNSSGGTSPYPFAKIQGVKEGSAGNFNGALLFGTTANSSSVIERMRIDSTGNIGIGTTSPTSAKLQVHKSESGASPAAVLRLENTGANYTSRLILTDGTTNDANISYLGDTQSLGFGLGSSLNQMVLLSTGNVGIGTTSPSQKLTVGDGTGTGNQYIRVNSSASDIYIGQSGVTIFGLSANSAQLILADAVSYPLGIGTISAQPFILGTQNAERMRISAAGNVGIGTTSPNVELSLYQASTPRFHLQNSTSGTGSTSGFQIALSSSDAYLWNFQNGASIFGNNNAERMRITSSGNVGIGTSSPEACALLHVDTREKGFLPPRMDTGQRDNIPSPVEGLMIWNYDTRTIEVYDGSNWQRVAFI